MNHQQLLSRYIEVCAGELAELPRIQSMCKKRGITDLSLLERFSVGYANGRILEMARGQDDIDQQLQDAGIMVDSKERFQNRLTIPVFDEEGVIVNIVGFSLWPNATERLIAINDSGIFNAPFLANETKVIITRDPIEAFLLLQCSVNEVTFVFGTEAKYVLFLDQHAIQKAAFACDGAARLYEELRTSNVSATRTPIDFAAIASGDLSPSEVQSAFVDESTAQIEDSSSEQIQEIEGGFLFRFALLCYRIIGNFPEHSAHMRANIKAFNDVDAFVDSIDLYKHRNRQSFIFNLMDRFSIRDQVQLEQDLNRIVDHIEEHRANAAQSKSRLRPELTEAQQAIGMKLLESDHLIDEIASDYDELGYVEERKNKVLMYLVMTSRLMDNPLHAIVVSRSGAGKSKLAEITTELCPPEDAEIVSDLSANALYYYGENDLKHRYIVIGEKSGSDGSEYPLRELISRKSITKAIPMKDQGTGQVRTVRITVNGPISLVETTTSSQVNPENLNRCFVIGIDESEAQTMRIHELQRRNHTPDGFLNKRRLDAIRRRHIYAQRLFEPVRVFNPYAELLTFPSGTLRSRRDNEKFLRLITVICFLHQFQRTRKQLEVSDTESVEYIECSIDDYRIAYELLSDGVLDNTLDDLPSPARKLLDLIRRYVMTRAEADGIPPEKVIFERKDIREFCSWSFAHVRNNFRILQEFEYLSCIKTQNGLANRYRINTGYGDLDYMKTILSPEDLTDRIAVSPAT